MKMIDLERDRAGTRSEDFTPYLIAEAKKVWELYKDGAIREMYFRQDQKNAVLILEAESVEHAQRILAQLPLVRQNLVSFDIIPLAPYPGFERLFDENYMNKV